MVRHLNVFANTVRLKKRLCWPSAAPHEWHSSLLPPERNVAFSESMCFSHDGCYLTTANSRHEISVSICCGESDVYPDTFHDRAQYSHPPIQDLGSRKPGMSCNCQRARFIHQLYGVLQGRMFCHLGIFR
jgi:hypothetical protein